MQSLANEVGDRGGEGRAYGNLGGAYWSLGDYSKAIEEDYSKAIEQLRISCWGTLPGRSRTMSRTWRVQRRWATGRERCLY